MQGGSGDRETAFENCLGRERGSGREREKKEVWGREPLVVCRWKDLTDDHSDGKKPAEG